MRGLRFVIGLVIAVTVHAALNKVFPGSLAYFNPYVILVVYFAMGGQMHAAIIAGAAAGLVQDAFSLAVFGTNAFALTVCGYAVAFINARLMLKGNAAFGACLAGAVLVSEIVAWCLMQVLVEQPAPFTIGTWLARTLVTTLFGMLLYQSIRLVLGEEALEAARRPRAW